MRQNPRLNERGTRDYADLTLVHEDGEYFVTRHPGEKSGLFSFPFCVFKGSVYPWVRVVQAASTLWGAKLIIRRHRK